MRRAAHEALTKRAVQKYHPILTKEATILVSSLLTPSTNLKQDAHFSRFTTSTIMSIVYDHPTIMSEHDHAVESIEKYNDRMTQALVMGAYFVDIFPWMKCVPERSWLPSRRLVVNTDGRSKPDLRNGSGKAYEHLRSILRCSEAFSIVLKWTLCVFISSVIFGAQLINRKGQWGRPPKFLCVFDTASRTRFLLKQ